MEDPRDPPLTGRASCDCLGHTGTITYIVPTAFYISSNLVLYDGSLLRRTPLKSGVVPDSETYIIKMHNLYIGRGQMN